MVRTLARGSGEPMTKRGEDYPAGVTPRRFAIIGEELSRGPWLRDLRKEAERHGTDTTWSQDNPWAVAAVQTYVQDFPTDPDGPYADLLVMSGLRDEDYEYDVGYDDDGDGSGAPD
jgi:hypothetical protein